MLTVDEAKALVPGSVRGTVDQAFVDQINAAVSDPMEAEAIRDGFVTYSHVLKEGKFKLQDYLNAVKYVSYKQMGLNNQDAYAKAFPQRWINIQASGKDPSPYVAMYHKNKLVNTIMQQSMIEPWLLYQDAFTVGIKTAVEVARNGQSEIARVQAANALMTHLKRPETAKIKLELGGFDGLNELRDLLVQTAEQTIASVATGSRTAGQITKQPLVIDHEP